MEKIMISLVHDHDQVNSFYLFDSHSAPESNSFFFWWMRASIYIVQKKNSIKFRWLFLARRNQTKDEYLWANDSGISLNLDTRCVLQIQALPKDNTQT